LILITGGIGFIGSTLSIELSKKGVKTLLVDIEDNNKGTKIYENDPNITFVKSDVNDREKLKTIFAKYDFDGIIHLGAVSRVVVAEKNPDECVRTNIDGTKILTEEIRESKIKPWLIFGSSREVYGEPETIPVKEDFPKSFVNIYGKSKIYGEKLFEELGKELNTNTIILRFSNVYGNEFDILDRVLPKFINQIANEKELFIEGGEQIIDFTHIDDTVHGILKAIEYIQVDKNVSEDFHILPGIGWTLYQAIEYIEKHLGKKAKAVVNPKRNYDVEKFIGDRTKIENILGVRDFLNLEDGLKLAIPKYLEVLK
jgi:nucleoside-diphosphate-sugar epimerase